MTKLEYVELIYGCTGYGKEVVCHYANGKTKTHKYNSHKVQVYILASCPKNLFMVLYPRDTLDGSFIEILGY